MKTMLQQRDWVPAHAEKHVQSVAALVAGQSADENEDSLLAFIAENQRIHVRDSRPTYWYERRRPFTPAAPAPHHG